MSLWIVKAAPLGKKAGKSVETAEFASETAAKSYVRGLVRMNYAVKVQSGPGRTPAHAMTHDKAMRWALE